MCRALPSLSLCRPVNLLPGRGHPQQVPADSKVDDAGVGIHLVDELVPVVDQILLDISEPGVVQYNQLVSNMMISPAIFHDDEQLSPVQPDRGGPQ